MRLNRKILYSILIISLYLTGCYKENNYYYSEEEILENLLVEVSPDNVPADGVSRITLIYKLPVEADTTLTKLLLKTTNGKFLKSDTSFLTTNFLKIDTSDTLRYVEVHLISSTIPDDEVIVTSTLMNYETNTAVAFDTAYPSSISLSVNPFYIKNDTNSEVVVTSSLSSDSGIASMGTEVFIKYNPEHGIIDKETTYSNAGGLAEFHFVFSGTSSIEDIVFESWTWINDNDSILASAILQVID